MKKLNNKIATVFAVCAMGLSAFAQNTAGKSEDMGRICIAAFVPQQIDKMPDAARTMLSNKLNQIITSNGLGGSPFSERFIITANITVLTKDLTATAPPMTALGLEMTFYIGDGIEGTKFASKSIQVKGVGTNETKAYIEAIKMVKPSDPAFASFLEEGKTKIMKYYNSKCDFIIKEANTLASQNNYEEAIFKLTSVPDVCKECYDKCMTAVAPMYQKKIDRDCKMKLNEATNVWNTSQDAAAASQAGEILSSIEPQAACFGEAKALASKIQKRVIEIDKREWNYTMKAQQQQSEMIKAYRDVGVAYGNGQPKSVTYNVSGWW
ncbi:MAG: hypothetical protein ACXVC6_14675 [Bacteroidia bacterium]